MPSQQELSERVIELERLNAELNNLVQQMLKDTETLFASRTWKIGYAVAKAVRYLQLALGSRGSQWHIGPEHFRALIKNCYAYRKRDEIPIGRLDGRADDIPAQYLTTDVETAIRDLWDAVGQEYIKHDG